MQPVPAEPHGGADKMKEDDPICASAADQPEPLRPRTRPFVVSVHREDYGIGEVDG